MKIFIDRLEEGDNNLSFTSEELLTVLKDDLQIVETTPINLNVCRRGKYIHCSGENTIKVEFDCDRCAETSVGELAIEVDFVFHIGSYKNKGDEDITVEIGENEKIIDFSEYYLESALLAIPFIWHCSEDCQGLCNQCGTNLNLEKCNCDTKKVIDPRWEKLSNLKSSD